MIHHVRKLVFLLTAWSFESPVLCLATVGLILIRFQSDLYSVSDFNQNMATMLDLKED